MARTHQAPPERVCIGVKVVVLAFLGQVHQERGQDEAEEADVPGGDQLLRDSMSVLVRLQPSASSRQPPGAPRPGSEARLRAGGRGGWSPNLSPGCPHTCEPHTWEDSG